MSCCSICTIDKIADGISVIGRGNLNADVMIIGIAPGGDEWKKTHIPFTGPAGKLMQAMYNSCELKIKYEELWLTNLLCWWNDEPSPEQVAQCWPRVLEEIKRVKPKLIITIGAIPFNSFFGYKEKLGKWRGIAKWFNEYNCYILPTYHPSAVLQGHYQFTADIVRDFNKIPLILNWKTHDKEGDITYEFIDTKQKATNLFSRLPREDFNCLDIECNPVHTDTTDPFNDPLLCLSINFDGKHSYVFSGQDLKEWKLEWPTDRLWTYQFGSYDIIGIERELGIKLPLVHDTGMMSYALDERTPREREEGGTRTTNSGIHGLKQNAREYNNSGWYELPVKQSWKTGVFDLPTLYLYNAKDSAYTYRRATYLAPQVSKDGVSSLYNDLLMPANRDFAEIAYRGVPFDIKTTGELIYDWSARLLRDTERLVEMAQELGWDGEINLNSPQQVGKFLYEILGIESPLAPSTSVDALDLVNHMWVDQWQETKHLQKFIDTYLLGSLDDLKPDMRLHPECLLHGTTTGRTSYVNPPVQTTPKHVDGELAKVRLMFCAENDDYVVAEADYSSAEMWLMAYQCEDNNMLADLEQGDFHRRTAGKVLQKPFQEVTDTEKTYIGKKINFGIPYGIGARKLSNRRTGMGCTEQEANERLAAWHKQYPSYRPWTHKLIKYVREHGEIQTMTGRKRRFRLLIDSKQYRQITNFMVQSPSGDYTLHSLLQLHNKLKEFKSYIMFIVHDSIVFQLHKAYLHITLPLIAEIMEQHKWDGLPDLKTSITIGKNWLEQIEVRKDGHWNEGKLSMWQTPV